jgi:hypothetical protein
MLGQLHPSVVPIFNSWWSILVFYSHPSFCLPSIHFPRGFLTKFVYVFHLPLHPTYMSAYHIILDFMSYQYQRQVWKIRVSLQGNILKEVKLIENRKFEYFHGIYSHLVLFGGVKNLQTCLDVKTVRNLNFQIFQYYRMIDNYNIDLELSKIEKLNDLWKLRNSVIFSNMKTSNI